MQIEPIKSAEFQENGESPPRTGNETSPSHSVKTAPETEAIPILMARPNQTNSIALPNKPPKDNWDKLQALSPIISGAMVFAIGSFFTYSYNQQQLRIQELQTIERFIPHLTGNEQSKKAAILAISSLTSTELAGKIASLFASRGTVSALQSLAETGDEKDRKIAATALATAMESLVSQSKNNGTSSLEDTYKLTLSDESKRNETAETEAPATLDRLASLYQSQNKLIIAEAFWFQSLAAKTNLYGKDSIQVAEALKNLAKFYKQKGNANSEQDYQDRANTIIEKIAENKQELSSGESVQTESKIERQATQELTSPVGNITDSTGQSASKNIEENANETYINDSGSN